MVLTLFNTLTRREQPFVPMPPGVVRMFVCGPTVYDLSHVGHAKTFDFVARYMRQRGYRVTYAPNITSTTRSFVAPTSYRSETREQPGHYTGATFHQADQAAWRHQSKPVRARERANGGPTPEGQGAVSGVLNLPAGPPTPSQISQRAG